MWHVTRDRAQKAESKQMCVLDNFEIIYLKNYELDRSFFPSVESNIRSVELIETAGRGAKARFCSQTGTRVMPQGFSLSLKGDV